MAELAVSPRALTPSELRSAPASSSNGWTRRYLAALLALDTLGILTAVVGGYVLRFGTAEPKIAGVHYTLVGACVSGGWLLALYARGAYEPRFLGVDAEEFKRVLRGCALLVGGVALVCYMGKFAVARGFVAGVIPAGMLLLVLGRWCARRWLHRRRRSGVWCYRILAVGSADSVKQLIDQVHSAPFAGLTVVAACVSGNPRHARSAGVPVVGTVEDAAAAAELLDVDVVAPTPYALSPQFIKELGWALEGSGRHLVMAYGLTNIAGPRIHITPVAGLPLVWVDEPRFTGLARLVKRALDVVGSLALLAVLSPLLAVTALLVKASSPGPVLYRQPRGGLHGREFRVFKFRSMYTGAHARRATVLTQNEADGHLFKIRDDPRVTPLGRVLRRLSLDELPQLLNVLRGEMSLVGPRPLPLEDSDFRGHVRRRLLVRPGITGLWQVSGRSDLCWDEAVRLDLYYVENWSLALDAVILLRTVLVVVRGSGAY
jgi:exopolysaccharide biosynthesis polyprenyl glycosylphosphotransferase